MLNHLFVGSATALVTPFKNGEIDFNALDTIIDHQISSGTAALVVCGTTGEPSTLSYDEQKSLVEFCVERVDGYIPIIAGTGGNNTADVIKKAKAFNKLGANAQLCVTPYYNKTTQAGLVAHYTAIAESTDLPIILYNVPQRTGLNMLPETVAKLAEHDNIIGLKEAWPDMVQAMEVFRLCGDKLAVYSGADELIVPLMSLGAVGVISVVSNLLPDKFAAMCLHYLDGNHKESLRLQLELLPLIKELFKQTSPIPIKAAMSIKGLCRDDVRLPLVTMDKPSLAELKKYLDLL